MNDFLIRAVLPTDTPFIRRLNANVFFNPSSHDIWVLADSSEAPIGFVALSKKKLHSVEFQVFLPNEDEDDLRKFSILTKTAIARCWQLGGQRLFYKSHLQESHPWRTILMEMGFEISENRTLFRFELMPIIERVKKIVQRFPQMSQLRAVPLASVAGANINKFLNQLSADLKIEDEKACTVLLFSHSVVGLIIARDLRSAKNSEIFIDYIFVHPRLRRCGLPLLINEWAEEQIISSGDFVSFTISDHSSASLRNLKNRHFVQSCQNDVLLSRYLPPLKACRKILN